jgi:hypothetical protein
MKRTILFIAAPPDRRVGLVLEDTTGPDDDS